MNNKTKHPYVIVLILSYNGKELLDDSISSYLRNDYINFNVVVIDNGSTDGTKDYVESKWNNVEVLRLDQNKGYSGGFNFGLDYAFNKKNADFVLITNNDVVADKKIISSLTDVTKKDEKIGFVTGKVLFFDNPKIIQTAGKTEDKIRLNGPDIGFNQTDNGQYDYICEIPFADDIFILVSKELFFKVGGYDETFFLQAEQFDWQIRAKNNNFKIFYTYKAFLYHKESMTIGKISAEKEYYNTRNSMIVILKHKEPLFFKRYLWNHFLYRVVYKSLKSIFQFQIKTSLYVFLGFFSAIKWGFINKKFTIKHFI